MTHPFSKRETIEQVEEGQSLAPKFDSNGLIPVVTTDAQSGELLMHGYMNEDAFLKSIEYGEAVYYSRSRKKQWHKGKTSGFIQKIVEMRIDDDQDCIWLRVDVSGKASCHVGYRSCFYRQIPVGKPISDIDPSTCLSFTETNKLFDPNIVYKDEANPTIL